MNMNHKLNISYFQITPIFGKLWKNIYKETTTNKRTKETMTSILLMIHIKTILHISSVKLYIYCMCTDVYVYQYITN